MEKLKGKCPICDGEVTLFSGSEESEIITCPECNNRILVAKIEQNKLILEKAPEIEEDWGE